MYKKIKNDRFMLLLICIGEVVGGITLLLLNIFLRTVNFFTRYGLHILVIYLFIVAISNIVLSLFYVRKAEKYLNRTDITISSIFGNEVSPVFQFADVVVFVYNEYDEVIWVSDTPLLKKEEILGHKVYNLIPNFDELAVLENSEEVTTELGGKTFKIQINTGLKVVYLKDVSTMVLQNKKVEDEKTFIGHIVIDNYQDIIVSYGESDFVTFATAIREVIMDFARKYNLFLRSYGTDSFLIIGEEKNYREMLADNFSIMEDVRKLAKKDDNPLTISIGIGKGNTTSVLRTSELAYNSLNVALSRGGDQIVVNEFGKPYEYYGAKNEIKQTRSHVRGRVLASSLANLIKNHQDVIIMGHKNMDFDALGAALGIYAICKSLKCKKVHFVYEDDLVEYQTKRAFRETFTTQQVNEMSVTPAKALQIIDEDTLAIVVDTHRPDSTMQPKALEKCKEVCVIDHHRKGDVFIVDPIFQYHEPQSSSASELVTELIYYQTTKVTVSEQIANLLLAGICLDTKFFKSSTSGKTFEMAMILKNYQASVERVSEFFKEELEELKLTSTIISTMKSISPGIFVATNDDNDIVTRTSLSKVAEEILETKDIQAVFVIGRTNNDEVSVSARSLTDFNVQIIMEKMNGGGHFSKAATQIRNTTVTQVSNMVEEKVKIFLRDGRL